MTNIVLNSVQGWEEDGVREGSEARAASERLSAGFITQEILLPSQYFAPISERILSPEQRLMLAILEDAVYTVLKHAGTRNRRAQRLVREAEKWMALTDRSWIFSFENICAVLGLEADVVRARLRRLQLKGERFGSTGLARLANQHRVVGRQHRVVLAPSVRRRLRAQQKARAARPQKSQS
ncbi:MAG: hypothetical protein N3C12_05920 [Candidatus Binatia bacterium]|nr:hypothetical protein [Candidatus Binatia bacterium]